MPETAFNASFSLTLKEIKRYQEELNVFDLNSDSASY